jgi:hypothetical protein
MAMIAPKEVRALMAGLCLGFWRTIFWHLGASFYDADSLHARGRGTWGWVRASRHWRLAPTPGL